jgi:hypothetical protein
VACSILAERLFLVRNCPFAIPVSGSNPLWRELPPGPDGKPGPFIGTSGHTLGSLSPTSASEVNHKQLRGALKEGQCGLYTCQTHPGPGPRLWALGTLISQTKRVALGGLKVLFSFGFYGALHFSTLASRGGILKEIFSDFQSPKLSRAPAPLILWGALHLVMV